MAFSELSGKKKRIKSQSYIYLNVISCYWQLVCLQVRKPFYRDVKCASFKSTKSKWKFYKLISIDININKS